MVDLTKASPRPWFLDGDDNGNGEVWSEEDAILEPCGGVSKDEAKANAALIVAAVNAYSPTREALGAAREALEEARGHITADLQSWLESVCVIDSETFEPRRETMDDNDREYTESIEEKLVRIDAALAKIAQTEEG